jgi:hypothetical protein
MISGKLSVIKVSEFVIHLEFDSGDCIAAYDVVIFRGQDGTARSTIQVQAMSDVAFPVKGYIGHDASEVEVQPGSFVVYFEGGCSVVLTRSHSCHEIGLLSTSAGISEIH